MLYHGYKNDETFQLVVYIDNNEDAYKKAHEIAGRATALVDFKEFFGRSGVVVTGNYISSQFCGYVIEQFMRQIDWEEALAHFS